MPDADDDALREAAEHRGLKLVKSRKRKAGVGDYGRYGLTDGAGNELFGFGLDGLTALPADIRNYLRKAEVSTWAQSAEVTPDRPKPSKSQPDLVVANDTEPAEDVPAAPADSDDQVKRTSPSAEPASRRKKQAASTMKKMVADPPPSRKLKPELEPEPEPEPEPEVEIRAAARADAEAIGRLIGSGGSATDLAARLNELKRGGGGVLVAERGGVIGCIAWHSILGLQAAPIGRITTLMVAEDQRGQGIGRALVEAALSAIIEQGCATLEAMSDIEVRNANGFYRALGLQQRSYRFVREEVGAGQD